MCRLLRISGQSLGPDYRDGDFVVISKIPVLFNRLKPGDQVIFRQADYGVMIKTIHQILPDAKLFVTGSHAFSVDSRQLGPIDRQDVLGKVIAHIHK